MFETDLDNAVRDNINECYSIYEEIIEVELIEIDEKHYGEG